MKIKKEFVAIIEARMASVRLPGKVLMDLGGRPALEFLIERINSLEEIDKIIVATTTENTDNILAEYVQSIGVGLYRGSDSDVLGRITEAAKNSGYDYVVKLGADCPLIDPSILAKIIEISNVKNVDFISNTIIRSFPDGMDCGIVTLEALIRAENEAKDLLEREHTSLYIRRHPELFSTINLYAPKNLNWPELGLTLDTIDDLKLLNEICLNFPKKYIFSCTDILNFLRKNPDFLKLNSQVTRKGDS